MTDVRDITPSGILAFWREAGRERWYKRNDAFDAEIRRRYLSLWEQAAAGRLASWEVSDDGALALVIVLDQFPRNMFRGTPQAFSSDALALDIARRTIDRGAGDRVDPALLEFLYMPLMHSEHLPDQEHCIALFRDTDNTDAQESAAEHAEIIRRFGRFPHRNNVLGRETTADEQAFLDGGGFSG
ncbi:DUF924 family protein [Bradyrhizobium guangzhouense]|uniref:DUF924 domain-containing protein n=1 Tax=Bradyrhizobium guangzhouense TaxID=1325095 RepID=A0AAE5WXD5_9BRAD|nr:DUF924 family protein [Bradyrhizobium guangzhouense]QAU44872.1 DUF924 domain-containing protein [Bradyrhizobium guangzhouense]RXH13820.1 DUF924 domain-containing protein [Bradyrhizobium guangzhouense]RXH16639.1 DUF924 domain-containing protein [Bradyrhizobium guangzhouense]